MTRKVEVVHLITGLGVGGAETMLSKLVTSTPATDVHSVVISLTPAGDTRNILEVAGVEVMDLGMNPARPNPLALWRLIRHLKKAKPDVIVSWLYHADFLGLLARLFIPDCALIWNLRCSNMGASYYKGITGIMVRLLARFSAVPDAIIVNSHAGKSMHEDMNYRSRSWQIIPNGFDLNKLNIDPVARDGLCEEIGVNPSKILIGMVARFDPVKGHSNLMKAAEEILASNKNVHFVFAGKDVSLDNPHIQTFVTKDTASNCTFLGQRSDIARLNNAFDVAVSASLSEGFPNTIGEAMACGTPCVVTDVGDCAEIVSDTGIVVPANDHLKLAEAISSLVALPEEDRQTLGKAARERISASYSISSIVEFYVDLFRKKRHQRY
jgi:glycosyltransferase involved in cell wall biosynthesis